VLVPGAGDALTATACPNELEDRVRPGQRLNLLSSAPACGAREPVDEHEAATTVTNARQVSA